MNWKVMFGGLITAAACGVMIKLGLWQLDRAAWKEGLIKQFELASTLPEMAYPTIPDPTALPLFRRAAGYCPRVMRSTATAGRNFKGQSGWSHLVTCGTGAEGPGITVDIGWSRDPGDVSWKGGEVAGVIGQDSKAMIRLISAKPLASGLEASQPPQLSEIPNNHRGYAVQWFLFAGIAAVIFALAARRFGRSV